MGNFDEPWREGQDEDGELWVGAERLMRPCERCGTRIGVDRHHRDRNKANNDPANIAWLCRAHHFDEHEPNWNRLNRLDYMRQHWRKR